jgi:eukaryotic-like serine/threonine-protein kinase
VSWAPRVFEKTAMSKSLGKYTLQRKLATGGMAEVFLAQMAGPGGFQKRVVVKRILPQFCEDATFVTMFLGEATLAAQLSHPNLVQIFELGQEQGQYFLAMEYIDGPNLRTLARVTRELGEPLTVGLAVKLVSLSAEGLHYAHELKDGSGRPMGLVHRDISPDNILLSRSGAVKVVDFGIAKATASPTATRSGVLKGKLAYMPPEQLDREMVDRRADVYALGIVLYELLSGLMPFDATSEVSIIQAVMGERPYLSLSQRRPDLPDALVDIVNKCVAKDKQQRFDSAKALQLELERFLNATQQQVSSADLAALIERHFPPVNETPVEAGGMLESTQASPVELAPVPATLALKAPQPVPLQAIGTQTAEALAAARPGVSKAVLFVLLATLVALAGAGVLFLMRRNPTGSSATVTLREVSPLTPAAAETPVSRAVLVDPAVTVAEPDAGPSLAERSDAGVNQRKAETSAVATSTIKSANGKLSFRIRPFATVFLDGKLLGETPIPTQLIAVGKHHVRLVNEALNKDVAIEVIVKPGENAVKLNLKE